MVTLVILVVAGLIAAGRSLKVVQQYEQGIICRFGNVPRGNETTSLAAMRSEGESWPS
jgi:regulator of protease activity HflC (stomatin/prohibitin superfamily)